MGPSDQGCKYQGRVARMTPVAGRSNLLQQTAAINMIMPPIKDAL